MLFWARVACALIAIGIGGERAHALFSAPATDFDDAYMFVRYANNWLAGCGMAWNCGEAPVYGATSLPHAWLVAMVRRLGPRLDDAAVLQACSRGAAVLVVLGLIAVAARFARHPRLRGAGWLWAALLLPAIAFGEAFRFHAQTGMDTMLAALANTVLVFAALALRERPRRTTVLATAAVAYAAYLVRPDNAVYAALVPSLALALGGSQGSELNRRRAGLWFALPLAGAVALDLAIKARYFGTPLPLGFYVKQPGFYGGFAGEYTWNPFLFLEVFLRGLWPFLLALVLFGGRSAAPVAGALLIPVAIAFPLFFRANQIMGHLGRFYFPALPFVVTAGALSFDRWLAGGGAWSARRFAARAAAAALLLLAGPRALEAAGRRYEARADAQALAPVDGAAVGFATAAPARPLPELDSWRSSEEIALFARATPPGTRFAMSEHGLVGARARDVVIIDVLGLHDPRFARDGFSTAELWRRRPDVLWMPHPDHTQMLRAILDSAPLWRDYVFYPDAFTYGVALRLDSPRHAEIAAAFAARWQACYSGQPMGEQQARRTRAGVAP
jgi:hypothetical protein